MKLILTIQNYYWSARNLVDSKRHGWPRGGVCERGVSLNIAFDRSNLILAWLLSVKNGIKSFPLSFPCRKSYVPSFSLPAWYETSLRHSSSVYASRDCDTWHIIDTSVIGDCRIQLQGTRSRVWKVTHWPGSVICPSEPDPAPMSSLVDSYEFTQNMSLHICTDTLVLILCWQGLLDKQPDVNRDDNYCHRHQFAW